MPRQAKPIEKPLPERTLVLDNGAYTIKAGFASDTLDVEKECHLLPNCIARARDKRVWIGGQLERCTDFGEMAFRRPVEKGYLVNWESEREIWCNSFFDDDAKLKCDPRETNLILTEAPNAPAALQTNCDQMIFEEFEFASYYRCVGASLNAYNNIPSLFGDPPRQPATPPSPVETLLLIDTGFSHTAVTPVLNGRPVQSAIRRLDIGGKFLTNYLKELVSIRHYNMIDETHLMNEVKEAVCYVSHDFKGDLERTWKGSVGDRRKPGGDGATDVIVDYVLPDYNTHRVGFVRPHDPSLSGKLKKLGSAAGASGDGFEDFMTLGNERFTVPELLFSPSDVGMKQGGLAEVVMQSLQVLPTGLWSAMLANVVVVGGNAKIAGFVERLEAEIRSLAPADCILRVTKPADPVKYTWLGGANLANNRTALKEMAVTRQEYLEHGSGWVARKFSGGAGTTK
ncbi:MAG: Actin- protein 6 [Geoglossum umbratile]|nr:MAG: Actin- protein 6 [Geoglossum umbratile]